MSPIERSWPYEVYFSQGLRVGGHCSRKDQRKVPRDRNYGSAVHPTARPRVHLQTSGVRSGRGNETMITGDTGARLLADWSRSLHSEKTEAALLDRVAMDAAKMVPGAEMAGVAVNERGKARIAAWTSDLVSQMDTLQSDGRAGPSLEANVMGGGIVRADDLSGELRWPAFSAQASKSGVLSVCRSPCTPTKNCWARSASTRVGRRRSTWGPRERPRSWPPMRPWPCPPTGSRPTSDKPSNPVT